MGCLKAYEELCLMSFNSYYNRVKMWREYGEIVIKMWREKILNMVKIHLLTIKGVWKNESFFMRPFAYGCNSSYIT